MYFETAVSGLTVASKMCILHVGYSNEQSASTEHTILIIVGRQGPGV